MKVRSIIPSILIIWVPIFLSSCSNENSVPAGFKITPGFSLKLVASEPLIKDPVDFEFNEFGDALVLEMPGYPFEDKQSRIILLKDTNDDGIYDNRIVYAEQLQLASSILPYHKGVLVAAPPYLLYVKDLNEDHKADVVDTLMGGFATENLQHNFNGLTYGLDHWIYGVNGGNSGNPFWWGDTTTTIDLRDQDFRINLQTKVIERLGESSGGFGLGVDEYGHLYETHNTNHIANLVFPDRYLSNRPLLQNKTLATISDHEENGLSRIYPIGEQASRVNHPEQSGYFSGACGITYYGGNALGADYENTVWVADVVLNLIHVDKVKRNGATFTASRTLEKSEFLASSDRSFRPVNMTVGPDGALYVVDMYREVIEHPEWIPDDLEKDLNLEAGKDKGRIYKIFKSTAANFDFSTFKSVNGLIDNLGHSNQWVRNTAHRILGTSNLSDPEIQKLVKLTSANNEFGRLHSLWILHTKNKLKREQLVSALQDQEPGIRENALIIAENYLAKDEAILDRCLQMGLDSDKRVRMQATLTISTIPEAIFKLNQEKILNALTAATSLEADGWNNAAITLAAKDASALLFKNLITKPELLKNPSLLASLAFVSKTNSHDLELVLESLSGSKLPLANKLEILRQLSGTPVGKSNSKMLAAIESLEKTNDIEIISELASLRNQLKLPAAETFLTLSRESLRNLTNTSLSDSIRFKQLALIQYLPYKVKADALFQCLQNTEPLNIQEGALRQLSTYQEVEIGKRIVTMWSKLGPQARRWSSDLLLYIEIHHDALLTGLEKGTINIGEMNFDLERRRTLLWWTDNETTKKRAQILFTDSGVINRKEAISKMKAALTLTGSRLKGAQVFETICSNCHVYGSEGKNVGPVLTEISRKSKESLMHDILDPNAAVETKYINHRLETKAGLTHVGIVDSETDNAIVLKKMGGETVTVNKSEIKQLSSLGKSLMMEGLEESMTPQQMADLLAFLQNID